MNRGLNGGKQTDITLKLQKSDAVNRGVEGGQQLTFEVSELCRFAFLGSQHLPVLHRPSFMISHVSSLNGGNQKDIIHKCNKVGVVSGGKHSGTNSK